MNCSVLYQKDLNLRDKDDLVYILICIYYECIIIYLHIYYLHNLSYIFTNHNLDKKEDNLKIWYSIHNKYSINEFVFTITL